MHLRSSLFLMAAAGSLVPPGAGNGGSSSNANDGGDAGAPGSVPPVIEKPKDEKPSDKAADKLRAEWKGKRYADIAAHHNTLLASGHVDEAAEFHAAVVKTFKDKK